MKCENCKKEIRRYKQKYTLKSGEVKSRIYIAKYRINKMTVCDCCYSRYKRNGSFEVYRNKFSSKEEKIKFYQEKSKKEVILNRYWTAVQKEMTVDELWEELGIKI